LKKTYTIDILDSILSSIRIDVANGNVVRVVPSLNEHINEEWITNKTRFSYDSLLIQRSSQPLCILHGTYFPIS